MQISKNIVNGSKSNDCVLVGIRAIVCVQKPPHHFCRPSIHYTCLRWCSAVVHLSETIVFILSAKADQWKC